MKPAFRTSKVLSLFLVLIFSASVFNLSSQVSHAELTDGINISVDKFRVISTDPTLKPLQDKVPDAFTIKFIVDDNFNFVDKKQILTIAARKLNIQTDVDMNIPLDLKVDAIKLAAGELKVRFVVSGTVTEFNEKIRIEVNIYDLADDNVFKYNLGFYEKKDIYKAIDESVVEAVNHIIHKPTDEALRKIAVVPFSVTGNPVCVDKDLLVEKIGQTIYSGWRADEYEIVPWWETKKIEFSGRHDELLAVDADAIIFGEVGVNCEQGKITVKPKIYLIGPDEVIEMSPIVGNSASNDFIEQLMFDVTDVSTSLISPEGGWLYAPYLLKLNSFEEYLNLGREYSKIKYYYLSSHFLHKALAINPDSYEAEYYLAYNYKMRGNEELAKEKYLALASAYPDSLWLKFNLSSIYYEDREFEKAAEGFAEVEKADTDFKNIHLMLGKTLMMLSDPTQKQLVLEHLNEAVKRDPGNAKIYLELGKYYQAQDATRKAEEMFTKALEKDPGFEDARWALRRIKIDIGGQAYQDARYSDSYSQQEKNELYSKAEEYLLEARAIAGDEEIFELLRLVYLNMPDIEKAGDIVEEGVKEGYFDKYTYYRHAEDLRWYKDENGNFVKKQLDESVVFYTRYLQTDPFNPLTYRRIGSSYFRNMNYSGAADFYEESLKRDSLDVTNYLNLAEVLIMIKEYDKAIKKLEAGKKIGFRGRFGEQREQTSDYLMVVAEALPNNSGWERRYDDLMKRIDQGEIEVATWNFNTFQNWLNSKNKITKKIKPDIIKKINVLTEKMKAAKKVTGK